MQLIDTHAHLFSSQFSHDIDEVIRRAQDVNIVKIVLPNIDESSADQMDELKSRYPELLEAACGIHPCYVQENYTTQLSWLEKRLAQKEYIAIGEIGLDFYWDTSLVPEQIEAFRYQCKLARSMDIPVLIHSRSCLDLTIRIVSEFQDGNFSGVFHCFDGNIEQAKKIMDLGFCMGIGGPVTKKKSKLLPVLREIGIENNIVLETDSPYLAPVPHVGSRNESSYVIHVANRLSETLSLSVEEVARLTTENAKKLLGLC